MMRNTIITYAGKTYTALQHYVYNSPSVIPLRDYEKQDEPALVYAPNRYR